jgi:hypothetical protein
MCHRDVDGSDAGAVAVADGLKQALRVLEGVERLGGHLPIGPKLAELVQHGCLPDDIAGVAGRGHADVEHKLPLGEGSLQLEQPGRRDRDAPADAEVAVPFRLSQEGDDAAPCRVEPGQWLGFDRGGKAVDKERSRVPLYDQVVAVVRGPVRGSQRAEPGGVDAFAVLLPQDGWVLDSGSFGCEQSDEVVQAVRDRAGRVCAGNVEQVCVEELVEDELGLRGREVERGGGLPPGDQSGNVAQDP